MTETGDSPVILLSASAGGRFEIRIMVYCPYLTVRIKLRSASPAGVLGHDRASLSATISGSLRTGKLTELATKQPACAIS